MIDKIGREAFDILEGPHTLIKYVASDYKEIELLYKAKIKEIS